MFCRELKQRSIQSGLLYQVDYFGSLVFIYCVHRITKQNLFKYTEILPPKNENFQIQNSDIFHISAQNIDCGYTLEPPR